MITKELVDFIKKSKGEGHSNDAIKDVLVKNGWLASDVEEGFKQLVTPLPAPIPVTPTPVAPALAPQTPNIPMQPVSAAQPAPAPAMPHLQNVGMNMPHVGVGIPNMQTRPSVVTPNLNQMPNQMPPMQRTAAVSVMPKRRGLSPVLIIVILLLFAGGASGYYFRDSLKTLPVVKTFFPAEQTTAPIVPPEENPVAPVVENKTSSETTTTQAGLALPSDLLVFADKLDSCAKYKSSFVHPFTGENMYREILGVIAGKCNYVEQMPNGGKMECKYVESDRITVAQYYKDMANAESEEVNISGNLFNEKPKITYKVNGKEVENPLQAALNNGTCVISVY